MQRASLLILSSVVWLTANRAEAQVAVSRPVNRPTTTTTSIPLPVSANRIDMYTAAPGFYGTSYGVPSYGMRQTYSRFSSPYSGGGYGYGYDPVSPLPGTHGVGIWNPGARQLWRSPYYGTYAIPTAPQGVPLPPLGVYAPAFGPGIPPTVFGR